MFGLKVYILAACAFAACAAETTVDFCTCKKNMEAYKKAYDNAYENYYENSNVEVERALVKINARLAPLEKGNSCNLSLNAEEYVQDMMGLCGGSRLDERYTPNWTKKNADDVCKFVVRMLPQLEARTETTMNIIENCDYMKFFDQTVKTIIDGCGRC